MTTDLPTRTSVTLTDDLRDRIRSLPDAALPEGLTTSGLIRHLVERGVAAEEEALVMQAYAEMGEEDAPYREARRARRSRTMARQAEAVGEEPEALWADRATVQVQVGGSAQQLTLGKLRNLIGHLSASGSTEGLDSSRASGATAAGSGRDARRVKVIRVRKGAALRDPGRARLRKNRGAMGRARW